MIMPSQSDVPLLCKNIIHSTDHTSEYQKNLRHLLILCSGPLNEDSVLSFTKVLNSQELLVSLLRIPKCIQLLADRPEFSRIIIDVLLKNTKRNWNVIYCLFKNIFKSGYDKKNELIETTWRMKEPQDLPINLVLLLLKEDPSVIETHFLKIYKSNIEINSEFWKESSKHCYISWSCQSPEVFSILVSILNQFLVYAKTKTVILKLISGFIINLILECEIKKTNFIALYPTEYQCLVSILMLEPEISPHKDYAIKILKDLEQRNMTLLLLFLSHFPKWFNTVKLCKIKAEPRA